MFNRKVAARLAADDHAEQKDAPSYLNQRRLQAVLDNAPFEIAIKDLEGRILFVNRAFEQRSGIDERSVRGKKAHDFWPKKTEADLFAAMDAELIQSKRKIVRELVLDGPAGRQTMMFVRFPILDEDGCIESIGAISVDVTARKDAEAQLVHAQRMDAIGQLTGGVAHDFNNLLSVIIGNSELLIEETQGEWRTIAESTLQAAERGADLTKRLLAFARRQSLEPRPTDVNALVASTTPMLQRTLGERIVVKPVLAPNLWPAQVDPSHVELAILNLAVNARDAMPDGGTLTIETANFDLDEPYAARNVEVLPGQYVMIAIEDTGRGMSPEVLERAFEPFFTTKAPGKGTGLGLSTVFGFVKQSGGHIKIYSEVGIGTVVKLYFPRSDIPVPQEAADDQRRFELPTGSEVVLLVEDDPLVCVNTSRMIGELGYRVFTAENAAQALALVEDGAVPDLLLSDVVMPGDMNGYQLATLLRQRLPAVKTLFTSGYAHGVNSAKGNDGMAAKLIGKPFRRRDLAVEIRKALDGEV